MRTVKGIREVDPFDIYDITVKNDHCFELFNDVIAHNSNYPKTIVGGGTGSYYAADNIFILGRQQDKPQGEELQGFDFIINIEKSRYVQEKTKIPITVKFEGGISRWSGLLDIALDLGAVVAPTKGWYSRVNLTTGEIEEKRYRKKETNTRDFWEQILNNEIFKEKVREKYMISHGSILSDEDTVDDAYGLTDDDEI